MRPIQGDLRDGVARTIDTGGLAPDLLAAIESAGGLWQAGDYYAKAARIVDAARANSVRALRLDARDLELLRDLPELEFLHLRSDGRPPLEPVASLRNLRALIVETGALRGTIDLGAHPRLEWLKLKLSGRGGRENLVAFLGGHRGVRDLRLNEVPFRDLTELAGAFPSVRHLRIYGGDRLRGLGDVDAWRDSLEGFGTLFVPLRSARELAGLEELRYLGLSAARLDSVAPLASMPGLRYLSLLGNVPSLRPLAGHPGLRILRMTQPEDGDWGPLRELPGLVGVINRPEGGTDFGVPFLEELPAEHPLVREWRHGTASSEPLLSP